MNRVQTATQKQHRVKKLGRKPSQVHKTPKLTQLGTPGAHRVHQWSYRGSLARPCRGQGWSYRGRDPDVSWPRPWSCRRLSCRIAASPPHAPRASARAPAPACPARLLRAQRCIVSAVPFTPVPCHGHVCTQAWPYRGLPRDTVQPCLLSLLVTIQHVYCDTLLPSSQPARLLQYIYPIAIQSYPCSMSQYSTSIATQPTANLRS